MLAIAGKRSAPGLSATGQLNAGQCLTKHHLLELVLLVEDQDIKLPKLNSELYRIYTYMLGFFWHFLTASLRSYRARHILNGQCPCPGQHPGFVEPLERLPQSSRTPFPSPMKPPTNSYLIILTTH